MPGRDRLRDRGPKPPRVYDDPEGSHVRLSSKGWLAPDFVEGLYAVDVEVGDLNKDGRDDDARLNRRLRQVLPAARAPRSASIPLGG